MHRIPVSRGLRGLRRGPRRRSGSIGSHTVFLDRSHRFGEGLGAATAPVCQPVGSDNCLVPWSSVPLCSSAAQLFDVDPMGAREPICPALAKGSEFPHRVAVGTVLVKLGDDHGADGGVCGRLEGPGGAACTVEIQGCVGEGSAGQTGFDVHVDRDGSAARNRAGRTDGWWRVRPCGGPPAVCRGGGRRRLQRTADCRRQSPRQRRLHVSFSFAGADADLTLFLVGNDGNLPGFFGQDEGVARDEDCGHSWRSNGCGPRRRGSPLLPLDE